jgi:RimJ/RimL family protein N-acetyltransferase
MEINYKILTSEHLASYKQLRLECLKENPDFFGILYEEELKESSLKFDAALNHSSSKDYLYGAFHEKDLIAICGFSQEGRTKTLHRGEISQMYVRKEFAGNKIGKQLLLLVIEKAFSNRKLEQIILSVVDTNTNAIALYKRVGFEQYGCLPKCFKHLDRYWGLICMVLYKDDYIQKKHD